jgi:putative component of toxin-antitoxin plasmid stabilization module
VKSPLEIILRTIHLGEARRVVTLDFGKGSPADRFLTRLKRSNRTGFAALQARIRGVAAHPSYQNPLTFKSLGDGLFEFKTRKTGLRLYAFYDDIPGTDPQLIIATCGGGKGSQRSDIRKARTLRQRYLDAKLLSDTVIDIRDPEP